MESKITHLVEVIFQNNTTDKPSALQIHSLFCIIYNGKIEAKIPLNKEYGAIIARIIFKYYIKSCPIIEKGSKSLWTNNLILNYFPKDFYFRFINYKNHMLSEMDQGENILSKSQSKKLKDVKYELKRNMDKLEKKIMESFVKNSVRKEQELKGHENVDLYTFDAIVN